MGWRIKSKGIVKGVHRTYFISISPLGIKGRDRQTGVKAMLKESIGHLLLSISPLGTKVMGWRAGLKAVLQESIGHRLLSVSPLRTKMMGWTGRTKGSIKGVHRTSFTVH